MADTARITAAVNAERNARYAEDAANAATTARKAAEADVSAAASRTEAYPLAPMPITRDEPAQETEEDVRQEEIPQELTADAQTRARTVAANSYAAIMLNKPIGATTLPPIYIMLSRAARFMQRGLLVYQDAAAKAAQLIQETAAAYSCSIARRQQRRRQPAHWIEAQRVQNVAKSDANDDAGRTVAGEKRRHWPTPCMVRRCTCPSYTSPTTKRRRGGAAGAGRG